MAPLIGTKETVIKVESDEVRYADMGIPYQCASKKNMEGMLEFYNKRPDALMMPITSANDTAFHFAAFRGKKDMLEALLAMLPSASQVRQALQMRNVHGNTPLHEVAISDSLEAVQLVVEKLLLPDSGRKSIHEEDIRLRNEILSTKNNLGESAPYRAAALGKTKILKYLIEKAEAFGQIDDHFKRNDEVSILLIAVLGQHFDTAIWLMSKDRDLAMKKLKSGKTCLHMLAGMPFVFHFQDSLNLVERFIYEFLPISRNDESQSTTFAQWMIIFPAEKLFRKIKKVKTLKKNHVLGRELVKMLVETDISWEKIYQPREEITVRLDKDELEEGYAAIASTSGPKTNISTPLLTAASEGIVEIVDEMLRQYPQAIEHTNEIGQNILQVAIKYRQLKIFKRVKKMKIAMSRLVSRIDNNGNTILHHAAKIPANRETRGNDAFKLKEELLWFKRVERLLNKHCSHYVMHLNENNLTARLLLQQEHKDQLKLAQKWMKDSVTSCSTVSALIATIAFASAFALPGGLDENDKFKQPYLRKELLFKIFVMMDVVSMATSLTSLVIFLSILSSSYILDNFRVSLPRKLNFGIVFLFLSVMSAMIAFTTTVLLLVHCKRWITILMYAAAFLPIVVFAGLQVHLYFDFLSSRIKEPLKDFKMNLCKKLNLGSPED